MKDYNDIIVRPIISERSVDQLQDRKYTFRVDKKANKIEIKQAVEAVFGVTVENVTTMVVKGKIKRQGVHSGKRPDWKKAVVKVTEDSKTIEFFDGMM